jgi:hypothetical protein
MIGSEGRLPALHQFGLLGLDLGQVLFEVTQDLFTFVSLLHVGLLCHLLANVGHRSLDSKRHFHGRDHLVGCFYSHAQ